MHLNVLEPFKILVFCLYFNMFNFIFSPWRIVDDCGGAFTMGAIGGAVFQSIKGFRNAPSVSIQLTNFIYVNGYLVTPS